MRKMFCLLATVFVAIAVALSGCNKPAEQSNSTEATPNPWTACTTSKSTVTDAEREIFNKAYANEDGEKYVPVATLATQVVAGINYAFLCTNDAESNPGWCIVTIYAGIEGNPEVLSEKPIDPTNLKTTDDPTSTKGMSGAWTIAEPVKGELEPAESATAFQEAVKGYTDVALTPIATIAAQEENGTNYMVLCAGQTDDETYSLYVAEVHVDQDGKASMTSVRAFDFLSYIG